MLHRDSLRRPSLPCLTLIALLAAGSATAGNAWEEANKTDIDGRQLVVSARSKENSDVKEVRGLGSFAAPSWVVKNVIDDVVNYKNFMPYTAESKVFKGGENYIISYQRLNTPMVDDRDYTIKIYDESREDAAGKVIWKNRWTLANKVGPPPREGVVRLKTNEGYWILEDIEGGAATKATYYVYTDPGGGIPTFIVNMANAQAVPELYKAVAKAAKDAKYRKTKPTPVTSEKRPPVPPATIAPTTPPATTP